MSNALNTAAKGLNKTPQSQKAKAGQVKNNAGGFVFQVSDQARLERFLILGVDGGTYYVKESTHARSNVQFLNEMIERDEASVLNTIVDVSVNGRAYKQSPALFALASVIANGKDKQAVKAVFNRVVRTGTHLYELLNYLTSMNVGWGRSKREIVASWFDRDADKLAYQAVKYRSRKFGEQTWTLRDVMRLSHPRDVNTSVADFVLGKPHDATDDLRVIEGFKKMQRAQSVEDVHSVLREYEILSWETIPTQFLKDVSVWKRIFANGQLRGQALVRNITRLARIGAFQDMRFAAAYAGQLTNQEMIVQTRLHPINFLNASVVYNEGQMKTVRDRWGFEREERVKDWTTESVIADALNEGFHKAFKAVEPAGKRTMLALDVSGSMSAKANGLDLSCAQVSAAMSMAIARTEPAHIIRGFTSNGYGWSGRNSDLTDLGISAKTDLATAMRNVQRHNWGGTDCSLPMRWALDRGIEVDTFIIITDNDTWAGEIHPFQALKEYRKKTGIPARLAVLGVQATEFTIADPSDAGMMDFVGFDSNAPRVLADFSAGRI
ncbi:Ro-like RNA binding protein [Streptomyces phage Samisti12]|uniref:Ro-like RNA binding protein n=1 Tax=Streptomyces phage Samisti12 TaxID=2023995 RepID=A0A223G023_9CAUD|nr:RNA-binding protein [Streptomyces phage Samisti12]AST15346.1 Ro-like RNA binding protein [Streptomyces phage Samisti12]